MAGAVVVAGLLAGVAALPQASVNGRLSDWAVGHMQELNLEQVRWPAAQPQQPASESTDRDARACAPTA